MANTLKPKNPNGLLLGFRKYHTWLGLAVTVFIVIVAVTGIYLNHKDLFSSPGKPKPPDAENEAKSDSNSQSKPERAVPVGPLTTTTNLATLSVTIDQALAQCREKVGEQPVERIELKNDKGKLVYKIKTSAGEVIVDADSGQVLSKKEMDGKEKKPAATPPIKSDEEKDRKAGTDWGKIIKDLHTGKLGGLPGKLFVDTVAVILIVLSATGTYLWVVPKYRKWRSARQRATAGTGLNAEPILKSQPENLTISTDRLRETVAVNRSVPET